MAAVIVHSDFGAQENKDCHCFHFFFPPSTCNEVMGPDAMIIVLQMLSFKPALSLSSFTITKRLFSSCPLSVFRVVSSAHLRLLIFLLAILIPACASSSLAFCLMYFTYKSNKQGVDIQPWYTPFPIPSPLFHVWFYLLLLDWPTGFSGGRWGGLILPSLEKFSTVCCDPHSQRL